MGKVVRGSQMRGTWVVERMMHPIVSDVCPVVLSLSLYLDKLQLHYTEKI